VKEKIGPAVAVEVEEGVFEAGTENAPFVVDFASGLLVKKGLSLDFGAPAEGNTGVADAAGKKDSFEARLGAFVSPVV